MPDTNPQELPREENLKKSFDEGFGLFKPIRAPRIEITPGLKEAILTTLRNGGYRVQHVEVENGKPLKAKIKILPTAGAKPWVIGEIEIENFVVLNVDGQQVLALLDEWGKEVKLK